MAPLTDSAGVALAQEQDVGLHIRRREAGEGALAAAGSRPATRAWDLRCSSRTASVLRASIVPAARDEAHQAAGADQVQRTAEEVVVDAEAGIGPVAHVGDLVLAERDVADHQVEPVVGQGSFLERGNPHVYAAGPVERLEDAAGKPGRSRRW